MAVLVVRTQECVKDVIKMLYEKNVSGALVADGLEPDPTTTFTTSFSHPYVGFISFSNMVLWTLQVLPPIDLIIFAFFNARRTTPF